MDNKKVLFQKTINIQIFDQQLPTKIYDVINTLAQGDILAEKYKNHPLKGNLKGFYDCHVLPDLVLIYKIEKEKLILLLFDIESHSNLF